LKPGWACGRLSSEAGLLYWNNDHVWANETDSVQIGNLAAFFDGHTRAVNFLDRKSVHMNNCVSFSPRIFCVILHIFF